jgi:hypothetical protein
MMLFSYTEPFREWGIKLVGGRARKALDSLENGERQGIRGAVATAPRRVPDEINLCLEPAFAEFFTERRSSGTSWLNIKQLTEPHFAMLSSSLQDRYKP